MKVFVYYLVLLHYLLNSCSVSFNNPVTIPALPINPATKTLILIDGGMINTPGLVIVKKRESVVKDVRDHYLIMLSAEIKKQLRLNFISDTTLTEDVRKKLVSKDSLTIANLNKKYVNAIVMVLKGCYGGFRQEGVDKVKNPDGSISKRAEYTVFFDTDWIITQGNTTIERSITASEYHSDRSIQSGLLARGPGFEANKKDILAMAEKNAFKVAQLFKY